MKNLDQIFQKHIDNGLYQGVEWKINYKEDIYQGKVGYSDLSKKTTLETNSLYRVWSMTKPIISVVILQLIEENKIKLNDPLNLYLPIFNNLKVLNDKFKSINDVKNVDNMPTIRDLLLHTAGFSYNFLGNIIGEEYNQVELFSSEDSTLEEEINLLATIPLLYEPSTRWVYSVSVDVLARIIEVVSDSSLQEELKKRIFDPLEMNDTGFSISKENQTRLVTSYHYDSEKQKLIDPKTLSNSRKIANYGYPLCKKTYARGGIGLFSTVNDYLKFAKMLLTGRTKNNKIILSKKILKISTENQISLNFLPFEIKNFDIENLEENVFAPYGFGYGFRVMIYPQKNNGFGSIGEFGWAGAASTYFLVDPKNELVAVLMTQVFEGDPILNKDFFETIYKNI